MLCQDCKRKSKCTRLCSKAERYVGQDHVAQRESCYPPVREWENATKNLPLDNISFHVAKGATPWDYTLSLNFDEPPKYLTQLQVECLKLFYSGYQYWEIARNLKIDKHKVKNCIHSAKRSILEFSSKSIGGTAWTK